MKSFILIFFITFFCIFSQLRSQSDSVFIHGEVLSQETRLPLKYGLVFTLGTNFTTLLDKSGKFSLMLPRTDTIHLRVLDDFEGAVDTTIITSSASEYFFSLILKADCDEWKNMAFEDIKLGNIKLYYFSGYTPIVSTEQERIDKDFEKQYKIDYVDFGDNLPESPFCFKAYNLVIFKHLTRKYGNDWMDEVREEVPGLKKYSGK